MILLQFKTRISAYRREYSASVVLSWYILWLKALAGDCDAGKIAVSTTYSH